MPHLLQPNVHIPTGKHGSSLGNKGRHLCLCEWLQKHPFLSHLLSSLPLVSDSISKLFSSTACRSCSDNLKETRGEEGKEGQKDGKEGQKDGKEGQEDGKEGKRRRGGESDLGILQSYTQSWML